MQHPSHIGPYRIVKRIGKGGMGEVFLALDPVCGRQIALKRIRPDLFKNERIRERFLREANIVATLLHPSIIPIYAIHLESEGAYYTMPYVEGETLQAILRIARKEAQEGEIVHPIGGSIPALIRIFLHVCQAVAYGHVKTILHRDLKPENIILGTYGEVFVLDWGLAHLEGQVEEEGSDAPARPGHLTRPGKVPGTLAYMAPERALGEVATPLTDIYALGVILYQILTLELPFRRPSLKSFLKLMKYEQLQEPTEVAPYREIPLQLAGIAKRALCAHTKERYASVQDLLCDLQNYIEGRPEWMQTAELDPTRPDEWEFQGNVLLAKHIAITRGAQVSEWVNVMISKARLFGNCKLRARVRCGAESKGVGFLLNIPEAWEGKALLETGDCVWLSSGPSPSCALFRSNVEVMSHKGGLQPRQWHEVQIEKVDHHLRLHIDGQPVLHYLSHVPTLGGQIGILLRDGEVQIEDFVLLLGSHNVMVGCLAVPDTFLANGLYAKALAEYRRIGYSFSGRAEGREALFRAGITLLHQGLGKRRRHARLAAALDEFYKLRSTPGAPLEYLGKALVYKGTGELQEEIKCFELCLRKYPKHPLLARVNEQIVFRLHEASFANRVAAYHFALLSLCYLPKALERADNQRLLASLQENLSPLAFLEPDLRLTLAFWVAKSPLLAEVADGDAPPHTKDAALFYLLKLGQLNGVQHTSPEVLLLSQSKHLSDAFIECLALQLPARAFFHLCECAIDKMQSALALPHFDALEGLAPPEQHEGRVLQVWLHLLSSHWSKAEQLLSQFSSKELEDENSSLFFLYGCWLRAVRGEAPALAHLANVVEIPFPRLPALLSHYLLKRIDLKRGWIMQSFFWERVQLVRQLILFFHCANQPRQLGQMRRTLHRMRAG